jgi:hypothetical protein
MSKTEIDTLIEDEQIQNQKFVCLSFLSPENCESKSTVRGLKIRGSYATYEEACERAKFLRSKDIYHDVYVGEVGKWLPWDSKEKVEEEDYAEKELNSLMKAHKEQIELGKKEMDKRRQEAINSSKK